MSKLSWSILIAQLTSRIRKLLSFRETGRKPFPNACVAKSSGLNDIALLHDFNETQVVLQQIYRLLSVPMLAVHRYSVRLIEPCPFNSSIYAPMNVRVKASKLINLQWTRDQQLTKVFHYMVILGPSELQF